MSGNASSTRRYILLMRHASKTAEQRQKQVTDVAGGLADYKNETKAAPALALKFKACLHASTGPALDTAKALEAALFAHDINLPLKSTEGLIKQCSEHDPLDPAQSTASPYRGRVDMTQRGEQVKENTELLKKLTEQIPPAGNAENAILVIGHAPQMDWLLDELTRPSGRFHQTFSHFPPALTNGEIACIELTPSRFRPEPRGKLIWTLDPIRLDDEKDDTYKKLLDKIKSKMDTSKLLGSIVAAGLAYVLGAFKDLAANITTAAPATNAPGGTSNATPSPTSLMGAVDAFPERPLILLAAVAVLLLATGLYLSAYISYDRLLMPRRFWADITRHRNDGADLVWRPPGSILLLTYQNMQRVWFRAFMPAAWLTMAGLALLAYAATVPKIAVAIGGPAGRALCIAICVAIPVVVLLWHCQSRPVIGAQD